MSVLELNGRVFDASTTGTLTLTGEGSATTDVTQGLAKSWINFNGTGTIAARDSFNVTSITDDATGNYRVTIANDMASARRGWNCRRKVNPAYQQIWCNKNCHYFCSAFSIGQ